MTILLFSPVGNSTLSCVRALSMWPSPQRSLWLLMPFHALLRSPLLHRSPPITAPHLKSEHPITSAHSSNYSHHRMLVMPCYAPPFKVLPENSISQSVSQWGSLVYTWSHGWMKMKGCNSSPTFVPISHVYLLPYVIYNTNAESIWIQRTCKIKENPTHTCYVSSRRKGDSLPKPSVNTYFAIEAMNVWRFNIQNVTQKKGMGSTHLNEEVAPKRRLSSLMLQISVVSTRLLRTFPGTLM